MDGKSFKRKVRMYAVIRELICISMLSLCTPYCLLDPCCFFKFSSLKCCSKSRKCNKNKSHVGKCDSKRAYNEFWVKSPFFQLKNRQGQLSSIIQDVESKKAAVDLAEQQLMAKQEEVDSLVTVAEEKAAVASTYE